MNGCLSNCYRFLWACGLWNIFNYLTIILVFFLLDLPPSIITPQNASHPHHQCMTVSFTAHCSHPALKAQLFMPSWTLLRRAVTVFQKHFNLLPRCFWWDALSAEMVTHYTTKKQWAYGPNYPLIQGGRFEIFYKTSYAQKIVSIYFRCDCACQVLMQAQSWDFKLGTATCKCHVWKALFCGFPLSQRDFVAEKRLVWDPSLPMCNLCSS